MEEPQRLYQDSAQSKPAVAKTTRDFVTLKSSAKPQERKPAPVNPSVHRLEAPELGGDLLHLRSNTDLIAVSNLLRAAKVQQLQAGGFKIEVAPLEEKLSEIFLRVLASSKGPKFVNFASSETLLAIGNQQEILLFDLTCAFQPASEGELSCRGFVDQTLINVNSETPTAITAVALNPAGTFAAFASRGATDNESYVTMTELFRDADGAVHAQQRYCFAVPGVVTTVALGPENYVAVGCRAVDKCRRDVLIYTAGGTCVARYAGDSSITAIDFSSSTILTGDLRGRISKIDFDGNGLKNLGVKNFDESILCVKQAKNESGSDIMVAVTRKEDCPIY